MNFQFLKSLLLCNGLAILLWISIMLVTVFFSKKEMKHQWTLSRPGLLLILLLYIASVLSITLVPLPYSTHRIGSETDFNFVPVWHTLKTVVYPFRYHRMALLPDVLKNLFGNILMFVPFGLLLPLLHQRCRAWGTTILLAFLFSLLIEASQWAWRYFGNYRHVDVDDVLLNTLGAIIGFAFYKLTDKLLQWLKRQRAMTA